MSELETQSTLPQALPLSWIDRLFERFTAMYGNRFLDLWRDLDTQAIKRAWAEDLAGLTADEIKAGLLALRNKPWPPTLPEFITLCRPPIDPKADWVEACEQMRIRLQAKGEDRWSRPQVYWAAVKIGQYDLQNLTWEQVRARWEKALEEAKADGIPEYRAALPKPGQTTTSREDASKRLHEIAEQTGISVADKCEPNTRWAVRLAEREAGGEAMSVIQKSLWRDALGVTMATTAKDALAGLEQAA